MTAPTQTTVLVTGADGFVGSHLVERLVAEGYAVRALCCYNSRGSLGWLDTVPPEVLAAVDVRLGDIRDAGFVAALCDGADLVMHLAAQISIPYSYVAPETFLDTNVRGTLHVLEAARRGLCGRVIQTSTSEVYGTPDVVPITEDHALKGQSPYSASKISADMFCDAYARSYGVDVLCLRPFNTYGPRQSTRAIIPTILSQLVAGRRVVRLGSLEPRRDMTFVADTVAAFLAAAARPTWPHRVVHLGTGSSVSVGELFQLCCEVVGTEAEAEVDPARVRPASSEVRELLSDPSRAAETLGWRPTVELRDGLAATVAWIRSDPAHFARLDYAV